MAFLQLFVRLSPGPVDLAAADDGGAGGGVTRRVVAEEVPPRLVHAVLVLLVLVFVLLNLRVVDVRQNPQLPDLEVVVARQRR